MNNEKLKYIDCSLYPFDIDFDVLDLVDILIKYGVSQKIGIVTIKFYCGRKI